MVLNHLKMKKGAPVLITLGIQEDSNQNLVVNVVEQMEGEKSGGVPNNNLALLVILVMIMKI